MTRDCVCTCGAAPLSKMLISRPPSCERASCCQAVTVPFPIAKSLLRPPRRQSTCARATVHLVDRPRVPGRDEQVAVRVDVDRVDVEVVEVVLVRRDVRLVEPDVVEAAPLEQDPAARDRDLLHDAAVQDRPLELPPYAVRSRATASFLVTSAVPSLREQELVQIPVPVATGLDPGDLAVGLRRRSRRRRGRGPRRRLPFPPGQHGLASQRGRRKAVAVTGVVGWNQTGSPRLSKMRTPRWPGPDDGAMKRWPSAAPRAGWRIVSRGGRRSRRETNRLAGGGALWRFAARASPAPSSSFNPLSAPSTASPAMPPRMSSSERVSRPPRLHTSPLASTLPPCSERSDSPSRLRASFARGRRGPDSP